MTEGHAFARAGLLGNPSDGYFGRALSVIVENYQARVWLIEANESPIEAGKGQVFAVPSLEALLDSVSRNGYQGKGPLLQAGIKVFADHCRREGHLLRDRGFALGWRTSIPRQVGLAGSSAIVTATFRALMAFFEIDIPKPTLANLILAAEQDELGITAGLQDRVIQVYGGLMYMDFSRTLMEAQGHGAYEAMDPGLLPRLFVAHHQGPAERSGQLHGRVRERWDRGEPKVRETMTSIAALAEAGRTALVAGDHRVFFSLMDENFDLRREIMPISERDLALVEAAREMGAPAKLTGSGGAVIGAAADEALWTAIRQRFQVLGAVVFEPLVE